MFSKDDIRKRILAKRQDMTESEIAKASALITKRLLSLNEYQEAKTILLYSPIRNEADTTQVLEHALEHNKVVGMPKSYDGGVMEFYSVFDVSDLHPGKFGILEPPEDILIQPQEALIVIPAVAYDLHKNRIGYGCGYYDRYLRRYPDMMKIGTVYDFQVVDAIESDTYDERVDAIITEQQIII